MAARLTPQARHDRSGKFIRQRTNGHTNDGPRIATPTALSTRIMPQQALRWRTLPSIAALTPQYVEQTLRLGASGNNVQQWELFDLMFDSWPELLSCYNELIDGVQSKKKIFEPYHDEDEPPTTQAVERMKVVSTALRAMSPDIGTGDNDLSGTITDILDAWFRGVSIMEIVWDLIDDDDLGAIQAPKFTSWIHPSYYGFDSHGVLGLRLPNPQAPYGQTLQPQNYGYLSAQPLASQLTPFPEHKFIIGVHKSKSGPTLSGGLLRSLCWWWVAANFSADWLLNLAQLFGLPFRFANYDPNAPEETVQRIVAMLQNMGSAGWAAFPTGTTLEFHETGGGRQAEYSPQGILMDRADRYARLVILGQTMTGNTMTSGKGGQAFGVVEKDVKQERIDSAAKYAASVINDQLIKSILMLNYGDTEDAPSLTFLDDEQGQFVDAQRDQLIKNMGLPIGVNFMRKKYGIPEPADNEDILGGTTPVMPPDTPTDGQPLRVDEKTTQQQEQNQNAKGNESGQNISGA